MQIDLTHKVESAKEDTALIYTKAIVSALKKKMKAFNAEASEKVSFNQLKSLFLDGAKKNGDYSLPLLGFARVNMFLRLLKDKSFISELKASKNHKLLPSEIDFESAAKDIKEYNLNFNFNDIEELYFGDINEISFLEVYL